MSDNLLIDISQEQLTKALEVEGVVLDQGKLTRAFRRLSNPGGCELCGAVTKTGTYDAKGVLTLSCCGKKKR